jgi:hypothetical protein
MFGFSSVWMDLWFKRTPEGWTFNSSYPRIFGRPSTYLLTDAQKATLTERLGRTLLISRVSALALAVASGVLAAFSTPDFVSRLDAGSLEAWLLVFVVAIALASVLVAAIAFVSRRAVQPVLCTARRVGPAQPDRLGRPHLLLPALRCPLFGDTFAAF